MLATNCEASNKSFTFPVSSQAPPLPINSKFSFLIFKYFFNISTISNSPLFEGFNVFAILITLLSKKYRPVIAKFDFGYLGFYSTLVS